MALYVAYKDRKKVAVVEQEPPEHVLPITNRDTAQKAVEVHRTVETLMAKTRWETEIRRRLMRTRK